jgi:AcrR family transcriptional regulator
MVQQRTLVTRAAILEVATSLFGSKGYDRVAITEICTAAGIANGTFYLHYKDKESLFAAIIETTTEAMANMLRSPDRDRLDPHERDRFDVEVIVKFTEEHPDLFNTLSKELPKRHNQHRKYMEVFVQQRAQELKQGIKQGIYRKSLHPETAALAEFGMMEALLQNWINRPKMSTRSVFIEQLCDMRARILFDT